MDTVNFSIVIPTWNRSHLVEALLKSLFDDRQGYKYGKTEVLIIDSSKGTEQVSIQNSCARYNATYIEGTDSVRQKRNKGIDLARYEYILFIDSDVTVRQGLLNHHAETFLNNLTNPKLAGSFGLTEFVGEKKFWWKVMELTTFIDSFSFARQYPYVSWTIGNNVALRKDALISIGKFEENFPFRLGGDDLDMTYRFTKAGYLIKTAPDAVTYHSRETWNNRKAVNDRAKRWGTMEYYTLKRHPELVHRRLPMTGDVVALVSAVFALACVLKRSFAPLAFWGVWCVMLFFIMYGNYVRNHGRANLFLWSVAMIQQGKYRFWRLITSLKNHDLSLAFKGQYFGIYHIRGDFRTGAKRMWLYYDSLFLLVLIMIIFRIIFR